MSLDVCVCGAGGVRVELLGEDEVGGGPGDGDEASDGGGVGDAEGEALADHVVPLGGVGGVLPPLLPLGLWDGDLCLGQRDNHAVRLLWWVSLGWLGCAVACASDGRRGRERCVCVCVCVHAAAVPRVCVGVGAAFVLCVLYVRVCVCVCLY